MIQLLSIAIFIAYLIAHPSNHEKFRSRLLWFIGAVLSLISTVQTFPVGSHLIMLLVGALPLLLAFPHDTRRRN